MSEQRERSKEEKRLPAGELQQRDLAQAQIDLAWDKLPPGLKTDIIGVLSHTYNGGYSSKQQRLTFEERRALRGRAYRALKAIGAEK